MRVVGILTSLILCVLGATSCGTRSTPSGDINTINDRLLAIAKAHIEAHYPAWTNSFKLPPRFLERSNRWVVTFDLPENTLGGVPVVEIDKANLMVLRCYHSQ